MKGVQSKQQGTIETAKPFISYHRPLVPFGKISKTTSQ